MYPSKRLSRISLAICLSAPLAFGSGHFNAASAQGGSAGFPFSGHLDGRGLDVLFLLAIGAVALPIYGIVKLVEASKETKSTSAPTSTGSANSMLASPGAAGNAVPSKPSAGAANAADGQRAFKALPHCDTVGGYEAYRKRTGEVCRLY